jgi:hypothetical protein
MPPKVFDLSEIKSLRDQVERLTKANETMRERINGLEQEHLSATTESIVAAFTLALEQAEQAMAVETIDGTRYTLSELQVTLPGILIKNGAEFVLQMPAQERPLPPEYLGKISLVISRIP